MNLQSNDVIYSVVNPKIKYLILDVHDRDRMTYDVCRLQSDLTEGLSLGPCSVDEESYAFDADATFDLALKDLLK